MAGYIGSKAAVVQVDGYTKTEADARYVEGDDTLYVDQTNDRVGVGTSNPIADFSLVDSSTGSGMEFQPELTTDTNRLTNYDRGDSAYKKFRLDASEQQFYISGSERMRIDASGNLLVGKSASSFNAAGLELEGQGRGRFTRDGAVSLQLNRLTSDGDLALFYKDGSAVGSIGVQGSIFIGANDTNLRFVSGSPDRIVPNSGTGDRDNAIDLGHTSARFDDIYATNGTIQTSDRNEKQDIAVLTATEMLVAARISAMFKTFRWINRVADNPNARTHTGIIAQDVQQAFTDEGLDAGDYSLFISDTWTDDDGNSQTRMGIRYPELLSFIGAYNEQRFTDIEARLTALEAV